MKQIQNSERPNRSWAFARRCVHLNFEFWICFGFRASDFEFPSQPNDVVCRHFFEQPIGSLLIESFERDRALDAVVVGAGRSDVNRRAFVSDLRDQLRRGPLLGEER